jgi:hypothetical protein
METILNWAGLVWHGELPWQLYEIAPHEVMLEIRRNLLQRLAVRIKTELKPQPPGVPRYGA